MCTAPITCAWCLYPLLPPYTPPQAFAAIEAIASALGYSFAPGSPLSPALVSLLGGMMKLHLVPGYYLASQLTDQLELSTLGASTLTIDLQ